MLLLYEKRQDTTISAVAVCGYFRLSCQDTLCLGHNSEKREFYCSHLQEEISQTSAEHHRVCTWREIQAHKAKRHVRLKEEIWVEQGRKCTLF